MSANPVEMDVAVMREKMDPLLEDAPVGSKMTLDLSDKSTPPLLRLLAEAVRQSPPWALLDEAARQWPGEFCPPNAWTVLDWAADWEVVAFSDHNPYGFGTPWREEDLWPNTWEAITRAIPMVTAATEKLVALTLGVVLGVARPSSPPKLVALVEAMAADLRIKAGMAKQERERNEACRLERKIAKEKAAARKRQKQARRKNR